MFMSGIFRIQLGCGSNPGPTGGGGPMRRTDLFTVALKSSRALLPILKILRRRTNSHG
jgi:hypothetical protein